MMTTFALTTLLAAVPLDDGWRPLFNGKDLDGWSIYLAYPMHGQFQHDRNPEPIFTVVELDDEPAIRTSGRIWGPLYTDESFEDFHLRLEFKWGETLWPPLDFRDTGIMYHSIGAPGRVAPDGRIRDNGIWLESVEYQINEQGDTDATSRNAEVGTPYSLSVERIEFDVVSHRRIEQRALGEWNLVEIKCVGDEARHYLNGELVAHIDDIRIADGDDARPLSAGKIQLQSESAEVFFRRIEVRSIESFDE